MTYIVYIEGRKTFKKKSFFTLLYKIGKILNKRFGFREPRQNLRFFKTHKIHVVTFLAPLKKVVKNSSLVFRYLVCFDKMPIKKTS